MELVTYMQYIQQTLYLSFKRSRVSIEGAFTRIQELDSGMYKYHKEGWSVQSSGLPEGQFEGESLEAVEVKGMKTEQYKNTIKKPLAVQRDTNSQAISCRKWEKW